jgi:hypothetical protein
MRDKAATEKEREQEKEKERVDRAFRRRQKELAAIAAARKESRDKSFQNAEQTEQNDNKSVEEAVPEEVTYYTLSRLDV